MHNCGFRVPEILWCGRLAWFAMSLHWSHYASFRIRSYHCKLLMNLRSVTASSSCIHILMVLVATASAQRTLLVHQMLVYLPSLVQQAVFILYTPPLKMLAGALLGRTCIQAIVIRQRIVRITGGRTEPRSKITGYVLHRCIHRSMEHVSTKSYS